MWIFFAKFWHTQVATDRTGTDNLFALETSNDSHPLTRPSGDDLLRARETQKIDVHGPVLATSRVGRKGAVPRVNVTLNCLDKSFGGVRWLIILRGSLSNSLDLLLKEIRGIILRRKASQETAYLSSFKTFPPFGLENHHLFGWMMALPFGRMRSPTPSATSLGGAICQWTANGDPTTFVDPLPLKQKKAVWNLDASFMALTSSQDFWLESPIKRLVWFLSGPNDYINYMGLSKNRGTPKWMDGWWKSWKSLLKLMIWGYHYFWKHSQLHLSPGRPCSFKRNAWGKHTRDGRSSRLAIPPGNKRLEPENDGFQKECPFCKVTC